MSGAARGAWVEGDTSFPTGQGERGPWRMGGSMTDAAEHEAQQAMGRSASQTARQGRRWDGPKRVGGRALRPQLREQTMDGPWRMGRRVLRTRRRA